MPQEKNKRVKYALEVVLLLKILYILKGILRESSRILNMLKVIVILPRRRKKKHKEVAESSETSKDPNSVFISDAETVSGNASDKEGEEEPEKLAKNAKYTKEDFIANKHGNEREPWVQKPMPFPGKKHKSKEEENYNRFCEWMRPLFLQIPLTDAI
jgi:hypothetical protein